MQPEGSAFSRSGKPRLHGTAQAAEGQEEIWDQRLEKPNRLLSISSTKNRVGASGSRAKSGHILSFVFSVHAASRGWSDTGSSSFRGTNP